MSSYSQVTNKNVCFWPHKRTKTEMPSDQHPLCYTFWWCSSFAQEFNAVIFACFIFNNKYVLYFYIQKTTPILKHQNKPLPWVRIYIFVLYPSRISPACSLLYPHYLCFLGCQKGGRGFEWHAEKFNQMHPVKLPQHGSSSPWLLLWRVLPPCPSFSDHWEGFLNLSQPQTLFLLQPVHHARMEYAAPAWGLLGFLSLLLSSSLREMNSRTTRHSPQTETINGL